MAIKSISDLYSFSLFIFDLDNTIYKEEDYLFQAYMAIAERLSNVVPSFKEDDLYKMIKDDYQKQGRDKLFDRILAAIGLDRTYISECLRIMRTFTPENPIKIYPQIKQFLFLLNKMGKSIFILTNGNPEQQKNKIKNIQWDELDKSINFVFANEFEPKPSPSGVEHILKITGIKKKLTILIGDSDSDMECARKGGIAFCYVGKIVTPGD